MTFSKSFPFLTGKLIPWSIEHSLEKVIRFQQYCLVFTKYVFASLKLMFTICDIFHIIQINYRDESEFGMASWEVQSRRARGGQK